MNIMFALSITLVTGNIKLLNLIFQSFDRYNRT